MVRSDSISAWNRLLHLAARSFAAYSIEVRRAGYRGPQELWAVLQQIAGEQQALAKRLDKAIRQAGGVPNPGGFPIAFTAWNDVALGRVVEHALELQRGVVAEIEQAAAGLQEHPAWPMIAQDALELARAHERRLAEAHGA
ncbi:MAG: hypothetical protein PHO07_02355 [Pirellulales bacterium]|jgi:hypothetical protein|nr:hypothetical protein [Thermoguttaceae bacterium]MDD4785990.1 hypothetical protein [Pirellulales bacterium]MDI9443718.1 hypothetical protein [Planctomycetota bacterium]NLZ02207.1 hypothetical protein [Pirellulaceae bacterium]